MGYWLTKVTFRANVTVKVLRFLTYQVISISYFYYFIGYSGYIPGIKAENVFGESYGKTTAISVKNEFPRGF